MAEESPAPAQRRVGFRTGEGRVELLVGEELVGAYIHDDPQIARPYFAHLRAPGGPQLTRNHPPREGADKADHPLFHPGLWMAFGDLSGADNWRLTAAVRHVKFLEQPHAMDAGAGAFAVVNRYFHDAEATRLLCEELGRFEFHSTPRGLLLTWDATFGGPNEVVFGDQEEMGLGVRLATALRVEQGGGAGLPPGTGRILDNHGRRDAEQVWGQEADWVDYAGTLEGNPAGIAVFCHPKNFRATRFHARDYGFMAANPFALAAFLAGEPSRVVVKPGQSLRLRYGVLLHSGRELTADDLQGAHEEYLGLAGP